MTLVDERPAADPAPGDWLPVPVAARRAQWRLAARIAWREVVRRRARTALVIALIAVPTAAMILAAIGYRTSRSLDGRYDDRGTADIVVDSSWDLSSDQPPAPRTDAELAGAGVPTGSFVSRHLWSWVDLERIGTDGDPEPLRETIILTDVDPTEAERLQLVEIEEGRAPSVGEVVLGPRTAEALDVEVGDVLRLARPSGSWTVSGIGRARSNYTWELAWMPGFDAQRVAPERRQFTTLLDLPGEPATDELYGLAEALEPARAAGVPERYQPSSDQTAGLTLGWLGGVMAFLAFGIVITAAFTTSARHQLASVGQLAANGAPTRLVARVLSWQGLWSGFLGGLLGTALAFGLVPLIEHPAELRWFNRSVDLLVQPSDIVIVVATATVAGLLAALMPARALARTTVLAALAGRRPVKPVPRWLLPLGTVLLVGGTGLMTLAVLASREATDTAPYAAATILSGGALAIGTCCTSPWIVQQLSRTARRLPLAGRLALRGLSRSRGRSAAVVSAIAVTVALAIAAVGAVERNTDNQLAGDRSLPRDTVVVDFFADRGWSVYDDDRPTSVSLLPVADTELPPAASTTLSEILPDADLTPLRVAVAPAETIDTSTEPWKASLRVPIADEHTLRAGSWTPAGRAELERSGYVLLTSANQSGGGDPLVTVVVDPAAADWGPFQSLMTEEYAREQGLDIVVSGMIARTPAALTVAQRALLPDLWNDLYGTDATDDVSSFVEPGDPPRTVERDLDTPPDEHWQVSYQWLSPNAEREAWMARGIALAAALVLVAVIVAIGLALAAADERGERSVFAAVGARPASIRRMAAWNAATMTLIGIAIGVPIGFVPTWVVVGAAEQYGGSIPFPWMFVVAVVAIVPAAMAGIAWLTARLARPPSARRLAE